MTDTSLPHLARFPPRIDMVLRARFTDDLIRMQPDQLAPLPGREIIRAMEAMERALQFELFSIITDSDADAQVPLLELLT